MATRYKMVTRKEILEYYDEIMSIQIIDQWQTEEDAVKVAFPDTVAWLIKQGYGNDKACKILHNTLEGR